MKTWAKSVTQWKRTRIRRHFGEVHHLAYCLIACLGLGIMENYNYWRITLHFLVWTNL